MKFDLSKLPKKSDDYAFADYIEIACLISLDREQTKADIFERIATAKKWGENTEISSSRRDELETEVDDYFTHLIQRQQYYSEFYPFEIQEDSIIRREDVTSKMKMYIFLLCAANLRFFGEEQNILTNEFEKIGAIALRNLLSDDFTVFIYGTAAGEGARYRGTRYERLCQLSEELCGRIQEAAEDFTEGHAGDDGIDLVAFRKFSDNNPGNMIVFAQCACSNKDWSTKQYTVSSVYIGERIKFKSPFISMTVIPANYRRSDNVWHSNHKITTLLIDRFRIIELLKNDHQALNTVPAEPIVNQVLEYEEDVA